MSVFTLGVRLVTMMMPLAAALPAACARSPRAEATASAEAADSRPAIASVLEAAKLQPAASASGPLLPVTPCGLPAALLARGWPRELAPAAPARIEPTANGPAHPTTAFSLGVLPDTQYYTLCRNLHFAKQAQWLASHAASLSLSAAIHLGDITESNTPEEWVFAQTALAPLLQSVPTFLATGNHDYGDGGTANRRFTLFSNYFSTPPSLTRKTVAETLDQGSLENAYYRLEVKGGNGGKATLGVLVLGWSPQQAAVEWANRVLTKYATDRVVFVTHAYLYHDSTRYDWSAKGKQQEWNPHAYGEPRLADKQPADVFDGEKLWQSLVSKHSNVFLTLNGHVLGDGTGLLTSRTPQGNVVHQLLSNYQALDEGGLGYLRLLEFDTNGRDVRVRTYSPSLDVWATAPDQHFELELQPPLW